jgi:hypothetical protein
MREEDGSVVAGRGGARSPTASLAACRPDAGPAAVPTTTNARAFPADRNDPSQTEMLEVMNLERFLIDQSIPSDQETL